MVMALPQPPVKPASAGPNPNESDIDFLQQALKTGVRPSDHYQLNDDDRAYYRQRIQDLGGAPDWSPVKDSLLQRNPASFGLKAGDVASQDVLQNFLSYGHVPTQAELDALTGTWQGGPGAVADYVNFLNAQKQLETNDPLKAFQDLSLKVFNDYTTEAKNLYGQLSDVLGSAPKLFGDLTPEQIQTYMAPLQTSFQKSLATAQGLIAQRGLAASSTENNAIASEQRQFQENVLAKGLDVGLQSQKAKADAIQAHIKDLFATSQGALSEGGAAARQRSAQDIAQSNLIQSLPYFERQSAFQTRQILDAKDNSAGGGGIGAMVGGVVGGTAGAFVGGPAGALAGYELGSSVGGEAGNAISPGRGTGATAPGSYGQNIPLALLLAGNMKKTPGSTYQPLSTPKVPAPNDASTFMTADV